MESIDLSDKIKRNIYKGMQEGLINNDDLIQIIELSGHLLNIKTISDYAKSSGMSYNGAKKFRDKIELFNVKFIIDNE